MLPISFNKFFLMPFLISLCHLRFPLCHSRETCPRSPIRSRTGSDRGTGIYLFFLILHPWIPAFAGMTEGVQLSRRMQYAPTVFMILQRYNELCPFCFIFFLLPQTRCPLYVTGRHKVCPYYFIIAHGFFFLFS